MKEYIIFDSRNGLLSEPDLIIKEKSPRKAVEKLYRNVKRDYTNTGDIVVRNNRGSYVFNGERNDINVITYDKDGKVYTEFVKVK